MAGTGTRTEQSPIRVEAGQKRVRVYLGGELIADSTRVKLVWERPYYPVYYFPTGDVRMELLSGTGVTKTYPDRGEAHFFDVKGGDEVGKNAAYLYPASPIEDLHDHVAFRWRAMDHWFEEDEEVFVHARDPYTRIDILHSSRRIEVVINDVKVADCHKPTLLFETGLPTRYYLPKVDVRMDLLTPTENATECPYKGTAEYWSVDAGGEAFENIAWSYRSPVHESAKITGLIAFYNEKVDIYVDGELQERPQTVFS